MGMNRYCRDGVFCPAIRNSLSEVTLCFIDLQVLLQLRLHLESAAPYVVSLNSSTADSGHFTEYIATFPMSLDADAEYKACILTTKVLNLICNTGQNSPAARPEFVGISLNAIPQYSFR